MDADVIEKLRCEEADLTQKLEAVRMILHAYGASKIMPANPQPVLSLPKSGSLVEATSSSREKVPLVRFSEYGRSVVQVAIDECRSHLNAPISSREMVDLVERHGIAVRGADKANAISALLARSSDLKPNGRKGWTLSDEFLERENRQVAELFGTENEPRSENAGGSDADLSGAGTAIFGLDQPIAQQASTS